jgi:hypothetical protein
MWITSNTILVSTVASVGSVVNLTELIRPCIGLADPDRGWLVGKARLSTEGDEFG